ncbi:hypothetical protein P8452_41253 [Trifolium repens]|nr:hypothetical protein P8452_41253 [Trifolium repens]
MASSNVFLLHHSLFADASSSQDTGHEKRSFLDDLLATLQTYQMEFDAQCRIGRPPKCFVREFGDQIESRVMLRDPNHNEFEIHVAKKSRELFFDDGWFTLKDVFTKEMTFYDIYSGTLILPWFGFGEHFHFSWIASHVQYEYSTLPMKFLLPSSVLECNLHVTFYQTPYLNVSESFAKFSGDPD